MVRKSKTSLKRVVSLTLAVCMLVVYLSAGTLTVQAASKQEVIFSENFDTGTGWEPVLDVMGTGDKRGVESGALKINPQGATSDVVVARNIDPASGKISIAYKLTPTVSTTTDPVTVMLMGKDSNGADKIMFSVNARSDGFKGIVKQGGNTAATVTIDGSISSGTTYNMELVVDTTTDTFEVYINGTKKGTTMNFRNAVESVTKIRFLTKGNSVGVWDDLVVSDVDSESEICSDNFDNYELSSAWTMEPVTAGANPSLKIVDNRMKIQADGWVKVIRSFDSVTSELTAEFDFDGQIANGKAANILYLRSANVDLLTLKAYGNGELKYTPASGSEVVFGRWTAGTATTIKVVANPATKTYSLYVNNQLAAENIAFRNNTNAAANKIDTIMFMPGNTDAVYYDNITLSKSANTVAATVDGREYVELQDAVDAAVSGGKVLKLAEDAANATITVNAGKTLKLDLNGRTLGKLVANGTVNVMDTTTKIYTNTEYGKIKAIEGTVEKIYKTDDSTKGYAYSGYAMLDEDEGYSFHYFEIKIASVTLRPTEAGIGYKLHLAGNAQVKSMLDETDAFGVSVYKKDSANKRGACAGSSAFAVGEQTKMVMIENILSEAKLTNNAENIDVKLCVDAYLNINGEKITISYNSGKTMREVIVGVDTSLGSNPADFTQVQKDALKTMYTKYQLSESVYGLNLVNIAALNSNSNVE